MKETELLVAIVVKETDKHVHNQTNKIRSAVYNFAIFITPNIVDQEILIKNSFTWDIKW